eukprot:4213678-Alexandrium_andersonii.AAC.1
MPASSSNQATTTAFQSCPDGASAAAAAVRAASQAANARQRRARAPSGRPTRAWAAATSAR